MCLIINKTRKPPTKTRYYWKVYNSNYNTYTLSSEFRPNERGASIPMKKDTVIISSRRAKSLTKNEIEYGYVYLGIHVYTLRWQAELNCSAGQVLVRVECAPEHWVANGLNHNHTSGAVFSRVALKNVYDRLGREYNIDKPAKTSKKRTV